MNDRKFLELLNLYLDGEITPPDAASLEIEIRTDPARRKLYNQYCRLHRATQAVCGRFREPSQEETGGQIQALRRAVRNPFEGGSPAVIAIGRAAAPGRQRRARWWAAAGLAACGVLTVSVVLRQTGSVVAPDQALAPETATVAAAAPADAEAEGPKRVVSSTTFAVPFAPEVRRDPYVIEFKPGNLGRFTVPVGSFESFASSPLPGDSFPEFQPVYGSGTSLDFLAPAVEAPEQRPSRVFRGRPDATSEGLQPVNFEIQR